MSDQNPGHDRYEYDRIIENRNSVYGVRTQVNDLEKQIAVLTARIEQLSKEIDKINSGIGRGLWIFGGGIIAAIASFITTGGLNVK
jgi:cell division protein FtsB